jgi:L-threonylcarbamoyladenylate synthase
MAQILRDGGTVVFPTETFYGLGAHALDARALEKIFHLKGRPRQLPLLCLVDGLDRVGYLVTEIPKHSKALIEAFWPGPLTLIFPARQDIPIQLIGPSGGVAVRWSSHPVVEALVNHVQAPIVGTSANLSGQPPTKSIDGLSATMAKGVGGILDGGSTRGRLPSTIIDCTRSSLTLIREGAVSHTALEKFLHH